MKHRLRLLLAALVALLLPLGALGLVLQGPSSAGPDPVSPPTFATPLTVASSDPAAPAPSGISAVTALFCAPADGLCLAGGGGGILRSTDAGLTWGGATAVEGAVDWFSCGTITKDRLDCLAAVRVGETVSLLRSEDAGRSWRPDPANPTDPSLLLPENCQEGACFRVAPEGGRLERSSDGGASWSAVSDPAGAIAVGTGGGFVRSVPIRIFAVDGGLLLNRAVADLPDPASRRANGWWRSEDGGLTWRQIIGSFDLVVQCGERACLGFGGHYSQEGRYSNMGAASIDGGRSAALRWPPIAGLEMVPSQTVGSGSACAPTGTRCALLLQEFLTSEDLSPFALLVSDDGGESWRSPAQRFAPWTAPDYLRWPFGQITFADDETILLFDGEGRLWRSPDGGISWGSSQ